jgi:hypothetical protein
VEITVESRFSMKSAQATISGRRMRVGIKVVDRAGVSEGAGESGNLDLRVFLRAFRR